MIKIISSLEKCFLDESIAEKQALGTAMMLRNETLHLMVCYQSDTTIRARRALRLEINSPLADYLTVSRVEQVPVRYPVMGDGNDGYYLRTAPGLYPDPLVPLADDRIYESNDLQALWLELAPAGAVAPGSYPVEIVFNDEATGERVEAAAVTVEILAADLPEQEMIFTQWFHCDCLMNYYRTEAFSERHWEIIERFVKTAVKNGVNLLLTPVFTPPLDTAVGGERATTQLVGVTVENGGYRFDFSLLGRWLTMCDRVGMRYIEISHLFTQWGAGHAPKIMATVDGAEKRIFGWETDAAGEEYAAFLRALLPQLLDYLESRGFGRERTFFHISDEPNIDHLESYRSARALLKPLLRGYPVIDALSNYDFYEQGLVDNPIPATNHIEPFIEHDVRPLWTYYCLGQCWGTSNRFIAMSSMRNRVIGLQFYKYGVAGFLHWGYNFYNTQYSLAAIDPFRCTDGEYFAPAGDAFSVYPAPDGSAYESLRLAVFYDALQDVRRLKLCEQLCGREAVMAMLEEGIEPITFAQHPHDDGWFSAVIDRVNREIRAAL